MMISISLDICHMWNSCCHRDQLDQVLTFETKTKDFLGLNIEILLVETKTYRNWKILCFSITRLSKMMRPRLYPESCWYLCAGMLLITTMKYEKLDFILFWAANLFISWHERWRCNRLFRRSTGNNISGYHCYISSLIFYFLHCDLFSNKDCLYIL